MKYLDYNRLVRFWQNVVKTYVKDSVVALEITVSSALAKKADITALTDGSVTKVGKATVGSTQRPVYLSAGVPTALSATVGSQDVPVCLSSGYIVTTGHNMARFPQILFRGQVIHNSTTVGWNKSYLRCLFSGHSKDEFVLTRTAKGSVKITPPADVAALCEHYGASIILENMGQAHIFRGDFDSSGSILVYEYDTNGALADGGFNITVIALHARLPAVDS